MTRILSPTWMKIVVIWIFTNKSQDIVHEVENGTYLICEYDDGWIIATVYDGTLDDICFLFLSSKGFAFGVGRLVS